MAPKIDEADDAFLRVDDAGEPRVADPRPPQQGEHDHPLGHAGPGRVADHEPRHLGDREHEDEVEEELERRDTLLALGPGADVR